jgi:transposase
VIGSKSKDVPISPKIATGVYWKPVFNLLEGSFEVLVVNAQHIKAVPGRKTDVKDAEWIADLLQHGLRHPPASFPLALNENCVT